jgi:hypothetical protein
LFHFDARVSEDDKIGGKTMSSEMQNVENSGKGDGKKKILIGVVAAVVVVLLVSVVAMAALLIKSNKEKEAVLAARVEQEEEKEPRKVITPDTAEQVMEEILADNSSNAPKYYTVTQNGTWTFADGTSPSTDAYVENDPENVTPIYFDLIVDATDEVVYSSPVLELGAILENFALDKPLEKGEYECTVKYHLIDEDQNTLTTTNIGVKVVVLN